MRSDMTYREWVTQGRSDREKCRIAFEDMLVFTSAEDAARIIREGLAKAFPPETVKRIKKEIANGR